MKKSTNTKYTYAIGHSTDDGIVWGAETNYIVCNDPYDFSDWLRENLGTDEYGRPMDFEPDGMDFWILDADGERTGEVYRILSAEPTDEDLIG